MLALVLRGFTQRKLRVLLTGIAIALGVALMAGTYVLTDTINRSFASIFQIANRGHDGVITTTQSLGRQTRSQTSPITEQMLAQVRATAGVAEAAGSIFTPGTFLNVDGKRLTTGGAPAFVGSLSSPRFNSFKAVKGRFPANAEELAIDEATAERAKLKLGQQMIVAGSAPAKRYTIVGITQFGGGQSFGGAGAAILTLPEAQRVVGEPGRYDQLDVAAGPGVTPSQLRERIRAALPSTVEVRTGAEQANKETSDLESNLSFLRTFLLVFAYVSLVVGAFIIFNTFSITVAQRTREFGLLRTLGGSRAQIMRSVVYEGLMLGVVGAVLGLLGGIALAPALNALFKAFGADLPNNGTVLETRTIVVSLVVGISVTVLAGLAPAVRATRVPPLAAMREGVEIPSPRLGRGGVFARGLLAAVIALGVGGLAGSSTVYVILAVVVAVYVAGLLLRLRRGGAPPPYRLTRGMAKGIGTLVRWRGITGQLAQENSIRQPGRTLTTAAALTVGLALVTLVAGLAAGTKGTIDQAVSRSFAGDLMVENSQAGNEAAIPALVAPALRHVPGVATVTPIAFTAGRLRGSSSNVTITAIEPETFGSVYRVEWQKGSNATLRALDSTGTILAKGYASSPNLQVGQTISVPTPNRLLAVYFPQARSRTAAQFKADQANQINTLLALIYVLLALSVIVSLFGIVNTLILSIYERTRELGMMRAIGTSRRQVRQMIRYESVITALIGGVFGLVIGVVGAILITTLTLSGSGYVQSIPVGTLFILLIVAAAAGLLAAQLPARRAARLDMLAALAGE